MAELGQFALFISLFLSGYAVLVDPVGVLKKDYGVLKSARNATIACLGCLTVAMYALLMLLIRSDFSVIYVAEHSSRDLPLVYKVSAFWAGASGSLLLWLWLQVGFIVVVFLHSRQRQQNICRTGSVDSEGCFGLFPNRFDF